MGEDTGYKDKIQRKVARELFPKVSTSPGVVRSKTKTKDPEKLGKACKGKAVRLEPDPRRPTLSTRPQVKSQPSRTPRFSSQSVRSAVKMGEQLKVRLKNKDLEADLSTHIGRFHGVGLRSDPQLTDTSIICQDGKIRAHQVRPQH